MPIPIIEQFQLGTNLPLDARYVVGNPYDVSLYWYDGMLIYNSSTNQLFVVKDASAEEVVEILDSSSNAISSIDSSLLDLEERVGDNEHRFKEMKAPTGFAHKNEDSSIYFVDNTFYITSDSSAEYYIKGNEYFLSEASISISPAAEGFNYFYFDVSGNLQTSQNSVNWEFDDIAQIAIGYWDSTNQEIIWLTDQRYGTVMDLDTRHYLQHTFGLEWLEGALLYDFSINDIGGGTTDEEAQFSVSNAVYHNEDLHVYIDNSTNDLQPLNTVTYYLTGPGVFRSSPVREFPVINADTSSGRIAYFEWDGSSYVQREASSGNYVLSHIIAANDVLRPVVGFQGTAQYETIEEAKAGALEELTMVLFGGLAGDVGFEWSAIGSVIYQTSDAFSNTPLAKVVRDDIDQDYIDWRTTDLRKTTDDQHGKLTGLQNDTHKIYALLAGREEDTLKINTIDSVTTNEIHFSNKQLDDIGSPTDASHATNKWYVDEADGVQDGRLDKLESSVNVLWSLPGGYATLTYVDGSLLIRDLLISQNTADISTNAFGIATLLLDQLGQDASIVELRADVSTNTSAISSINAYQLIQDASIDLKANISDVYYKTYIDGSLNVKADTAYVDGSLALRDASIQWLSNNTYTRTYIDGSLNLKVDQTYFDSSITQAYSDLTVTEGLNIDISNNVISTVQDPSFNSATIVTDLSLGGDFLFDYENTLTVAKSGAKYTSIQSAIDDSTDTDIIRVFPGDYTEDVSITKEIRLVGLDSGNTKIIGKTSITGTSITASIINIQMTNTNDHALEIDNSGGNIRVFNTRIASTYTSGAGQTADTAKSPLKHSAGELTLENTLLSVFASGDNVATHNTSGAWLSGTNQANLSLYTCVFLVFNFLDPNQNLSLVFNNNTNSLSGFTGNVGDSTIQGVASAGNNIYPLYAKGVPVQNRMVITNYSVVMINSDNLCIAKSIDSSVAFTSARNSFLPANIPSVNIACTDSSTSTSAFNEDFVNADGPPIVEGDSDYFLRMKKVAYISGNQEYEQKIKFAPFTNPDPSSGELWYDGNKLVFGTDEGVRPLIPSVLNIGDGESFVSGQDASFNWLFRTIDASGGNIITTDGSTLLVDSSISVPGAVTAAGFGYSGPIDYQFNAIHFVTKAIRSQVSNSFSEVGNTGITQLPNYDASGIAATQFVPWGDIIYDASGSGSTIRYKDFNVFFSNLQQVKTIDVSIDVSSLADNLYSVFINSDGNVELEAGTLNRISYAEKAYFGALAVYDGSLNAIGRYLDLYSTPREARDIRSITPRTFTGLGFYADTSAHIGRNSGIYFIEGRNFDDIDFFNDTFSGSQNLVTFGAETTLSFFEGYDKGYDTSIGQYTDFRTYSSRYWDTTAEAFLDASAGKFLIGSIYLTGTTDLNIIIRGSVQYDTIEEAEAGVVDFETNSAPHPQILDALFPKVTYFLIKSDIDDCTDANQLQFIILDSVSSGGGSGGGGIIGANNLGTGEGIYSSTIADILELKSLKSLTSNLTVSSTSSEIQFSVKDYDVSISENALEIENLRTYVDSSLNLKLDLSGGTLSGPLDAPDINITNDLSIGGGIFIENLDTSTNTNVLSIDTAGKVFDTGVPTSNITTQEIFDINTNFDIIVTKGIYYVNATLGDITIRLPDASISNDGSQLRIIKNGGSNSVFVTTIGGTQEIGGSTTQTLTQDNKGFSTVADSDNDQWLIVQDNRFLEGSVQGELQYWDENLRWRPTGANLFWDASSNSLNVQDISISGSIYNANLDASFAAERIYVDGSFNIQTIWNEQQDASIIDLRADISLNAFGIATLFSDQLEQDASITALFIENDIQDASIIALRAEDVRQDGSLNLLFQENDIQDSSIVRIDGSIVNLYDTKVDRAGDTMTGDLIISGAGLDVSADASFGQEVNISQILHLEPYVNPDPSFGDIWIDQDPAGDNVLYFAHPIGTEDGSSWNLTDRLLRTPDDWGISFPESSALLVGDRVLVEKADNGFAKEWVSAEAFANSTVALLYPAYTDSLVEQSTTSTTPVLAATLTADSSSPAGTYRVGWSVQVANSKNAKDTFYTIEIDGSILDVATVTAVAANSYSNWSGFQTLYLAENPTGHQLQVYYYAGAASTAYIRDIRLEYRKADVDIVGG